MSKHWLFVLICCCLFFGSPCLGFLSIGYRNYNGLEHRRLLGQRKLAIKPRLFYKMPHAKMQEIVRPLSPNLSELRCKQQRLKSTLYEDTLLDEQQGWLSRLSNSYHIRKLYYTLTDTRMMFLLFYVGIIALVISDSIRQGLISSIGWLLPAATSSKNPSASAYFNPQARTKSAVASDTKAAINVAGAVDSSKQVTPVDAEKLQQYECDKCGMALYPAKNRAKLVFSNPKFKCSRCGAPASSYFDIDDMTDSRAVDRKLRLEIEDLKRIKEDQEDEEPESDLDEDDTV